MAAERNTHDTVRIEYAAPLSLNIDTGIENTLLLRGHSEPPPYAIEHDVRSSVRLAAAYMQNGVLDGR